MTNNQVFRYVLVDSSEDFEALVDERFVSKEIELPVGARVLDITFGVRGIMIWALINPDEPGVQTRTFALVGNGVKIPGEEFVYIGTYRVPGQVTIHCFEVTV